jgi:4-amino-4-deoxy-L-arabinose transferase-like glycosyltransferase
LLFPVIFRGARDRLSLRGRALSITSPPLSLLTMYYLNIVFFLALLPVYAWFPWYGDWAYHYGVAKTYLGTPSPEALAATWGASSLVTRTPLFNLVGAYFMSFLGDSFWVFQTVSGFINSCFVLSFYLIIKRLLNEKAARLSFFLAFFNPLLMRHSLYPWPKSFTTYLILLSFFFYLQYRDAQRALIPSDDWKPAVALSGIFAGGAYMSHQSAVFYILFIIVDSLLLRRQKISDRHPYSRFFVRFFICCAVVILPWHAWIMTVFGIKRVLQDWLLFNSEGLGALSTIKIMCLNAIDNVSPYHLIADILKHPTLGRVYASLSTTYTMLIYGSITYSVSIFLLIAAIKHLRTHPSGKSSFKTIAAEILGSRHLPTLMLVIIGCVGGVLVCRANRGIWGGQFTVITVYVVLIILGYAANLVSHSRRRVLLLTSLLCEFILAIWLQNYLVISGIGWHEDANWDLKSKCGAIFVRDYVGNAWALFALAAIACEIYVLSRFANYIAKDQALRIGPSDSTSR